MPELPEVEITRLKLMPLVGKKIFSFLTDLPSQIKSNYYIGPLTHDISNRVITSIIRHGKVIYIHLQKENIENKIIAFHQRMSGRFSISSVPVHTRPHTHIVITFHDKTSVHFIDPRKFGVVWYGKKEELMTHSYLRLLGPDALGIPFMEFNVRLTKYKGWICEKCQRLRS